MIRVCLVLLAFAGTLIAYDSPAQASARLALVLGNGNYEFGRLKNPVNDAALMAESLRKVGFQVFEHLDADQRNMKRAIVGFGKALADAGEDAVGLVYYAGHGVQYSGENYIIPVGAQIEDDLDIDIEGIRASTLLAALDRAGNRLNIVILDACRSNPFTAVSRSAPSGLARMDAPSGTLLAYSTAPGRIASDGTGSNSPYTRALAKAIQKPGAKVEDVFKSVRVSVMDRTGERQVPWEASSLTGDFYFVEGSGAAASGQQIAAATAGDAGVEIEYWRSISDSVSPDAFRGYLTRYPDGLFAAIAEERIDRLSQNGRQDQQAEFVYFQSIQNSNEIADFEAYLLTYPNGAFAGIARRQIEALRAGAAQNAPLGESAIEAQLWQDLKASDDPAMLEAFVLRYPDGQYVELAEARLQKLKARPRANGSAAQVASAAPAATGGSLLQRTWAKSLWTGDASVTGSASRSGSWCRSGSDLAMKLTVSSGEAHGTIQGAEGGDISIRGRFLNGRFFGRLSNHYQVEGTAQGSTLSGRIWSTGSVAGCSGEFELKLAQ